MNKTEDLLSIYQNCTFRLESYNNTNALYSHIFSGIKVVMTCPNGQLISWDLQEPSDLIKFELFKKPMQGNYES